MLWNRAWNEPTRTFGSSATSRDRCSGLNEVERNGASVRRSAFYQATVFGGFTTVWTAVALLLIGAAYRLGAQTVGLLALVGVATMFSTPVAGRQADRRGPDRINLISLLGVLATAAALAVGAVGGAAGMAALTVGKLVLDVAMQSGMVANQTRIWALRPDVRGCLNTAYMTCAYLGSAVGSWLGARTYTHLGWVGVCAVLALVTTTALARHLHRLNRPHAPQATHPD